MAQRGGSGLRSLGGVVVRCWLSGIISKTPLLIVLAGLQELGLLRPLCPCGLSKVAAPGQPHSSGALSSFRSQTTSLLLFVYSTRPCSGGGDVFFLFRKLSGFCLHFWWFEISTTIFAVVNLDDMMMMVVMMVMMMLHSLSPLNLVIPNFLNLPLEMSCDFFGVSVPFLDSLADSWQTWDLPFFFRPWPWALRSVAGGCSALVHTPAFQPYPFSLQALLGFFGGHVLCPKFSIVSFTNFFKDITFTLQSFVGPLNSVFFESCFVEFIAPVKLFSSNL